MKTIYGQATARNGWHGEWSEPKRRGTPTAEQCDEFTRRLDTMEGRPHFRELTSENYHSHTDWLSSSMLKVGMDSWRKFEAAYIHKPPTYVPKVTKEKIIGTCGHAAILEPHVLDGVCLEIPAAVLNADGHRKGGNWTAFSKEHSDRILLTSEEIGHVRGIFESVYRHPQASKLMLAAGKCERSIFWTCEQTEIRRRVRLDKEINAWGFVDLKVTNDVDDRVFAASANRFRYHCQGEYYSDGYQAMFGSVPNYAFIVVEPEPPYLCKVFDFSDKDKALGRKLVDNALAEFSRRLAEGDWSDQSEHSAITLNLPTYAHFQESDA